MEALDTNHDGILSADEIAHAPASLRKLDKNGDGQLTEDELRPPPPPGGHGGPPRGQPGPGGPGGNSAQLREEIGPRPPPPGQPRGATQDRPAADALQHAPAAVRSQPPPHLEDDPVARRLDTGEQTARGQMGSPPSAPATLFDLLDANHDGTLSEEELRNAPAVLRQLDLKSITLPLGTPGNGADSRRAAPPAQ